MEEVLDMSQDSIDSLKEEAKLISSEILMRYIRVFSELGNQIRYASQKRITIEIAIIKLCRPEMETDYESIVDRLDNLERKIANGIPVVSGQNMAVQQTVQSQAAPMKKPELPKAIPEDIQAAIKNWRSIISEVGGNTKVYLNKAIPTLGNASDLQLVYDDENAFAYLNENRAGCLDLVKEKLAERTGKDIPITIKKNETGQNAKDVVPDLRDLIQFDIVEENF